MADKYWFQHDYNARNDDKLMELRAEYGAEGYGVFWMLLEKMAETEQGWLDGRLMGGLSMDLSIERKMTQSIVDFCLDIGLFFKNDVGFIVNSRMLEHKEKRKNQSEYGKKGVFVREANRQTKAPLSNPSSEKIRGEEIREDNTYTFNEFWDLYAKKVDTAKCKKKWGSIPPKDKLKIKEALPIYLQSTPSMKYRKNPLTWLNGNCWLDVTENNFYINGSGTPKKESSKW